MSHRHPVAWRAILAGGLIAGSVDILAAFLINGLNPVVILHAIASGVLGKAAFFDSVASAVLGLVLQWLMGLLIAAVFMVTAARFVGLKRHWAMAGIAYGVVIFFVMNYLVVPLSAAPFQAHHYGLQKFIENFLAMILFGLIVSFCAHGSQVSAPLSKAG